MNETKKVINEKGITCIVCPNGCNVIVRELESGELEVSGFECKRGDKYARDEYIEPKRIVATTVRIHGASIPLIPVRTREAVPKNRINEILDILAREKVNAPKRCGDVIISNILGLGTDVIATRTLQKGTCETVACST